MGTTELLALQTSLGVLIGDSNDTYSSNYTKAINNASAEIHDVLFIPLDNMDLITGNILPTFLWSTAALLDFYSEPSGTLLKTTDGDYIRRGSSSAKITASGANDVLYIDSTDYPRLLDTMGKSVEFKDYAYPVDADDDAFLTIQYTKSDGTSVTVNSTTECDSGEFTLLEKSQAIPDGIKQIQFRMRVLTTNQNVYFDMPLLTGADVREYLLPTDFQGGHLSSVEVQTLGDADDLHPTRWETVYDWKIIEDGGYKYLRLPADYTTKRQIRLIGYKALETLSSGTNTISIDGERVNLLLSYAAFKLFEIESQEIQYIVDGYTSAITDIDTEIDTPVASINTLKATITTADTALNDITTDIATATTAVDLVATQIETVDTDITGVQTGIDTIITAIATEETALDDITAVIATANNGINNVAASIATTQLLIDAAVTAVATVASEDISRYEALIARNQAVIDGKVAVRDQETAKRDYLLIKRTAKVDDLRRLDDDIKRMIDARTRYLDKRSRIQDKRDEVKAKRANLIVKRDAKDADIKRLDDQRKRLDDEITRFEAERNRIAQKRNESKDVMANLKLRSLEWLAKYNRLLPSLRMTLPAVTMKVGF